MDKYAIMTELFLSNPRMKAWHPDTVYETLKEMDRRGQLIVYKPGTKMKAFAGYVFATDDYERPIVNKEEIKFMNTGKNVIPVFWWSDLGFGLMKKLFKKLLQIAISRGGSLWSWRHQRLMKFRGDRGGSS